MNDAQAKTVAKRLHLLGVLLKSNEHARFSYTSTQIRETVFKGLLLPFSRVHLLVVTDLPFFLTEVCPR